MGKSKFYTDFLLKKMQVFSWWKSWHTILLITHQSHEAAADLKNQTKAVRAKKRAEKEQKEGKKQDNEEPSKETSANKKRKGRRKSGDDEDDTEEERKAKKAKLEKVEGDRKFEGKAIPENQPLLLTGWLYPGPIKCLCPHL